jgi:hypothetical protein
MRFIFGLLGPLYVFLYYIDTSIVTCFQHRSSYPLIHSIRSLDKRTWHGYAYRAEGTGSSSRRFSSVSVNDISKQVKDFRNQLNLDEKSKLMIDALRGKNLNQDETQNNKINMQVVEITGDDLNASDINDVLPTSYDPARLEAYFGKRPKAVFTRIWQVMSTSAGYFAGLLG